VTLLETAAQDRVVNHDDAVAHFSASTHWLGPTALPASGGKRPESAKVAAVKLGVAGVCAWSGDAGANATATNQRNKYRIL